MMDCLVTIENAMKTYNLLSLHMPESHWGGVTLSYNCNQQGNIMLVGECNPFCVNSMD